MMAIDDQPDDKSETAQQHEQSAVRGAFLGRRAHDETLTGGGGEIGNGISRGAFLSRVARETRGRGTGVAGSEDAGGAVVRGIYAARTVVVTVARAVVRAATPRPARSAAKGRKKAAAAKKAVPAKKKSRPAKKAKAAARPAKRKMAAPVRKAAPVRRLAAKKPAAKKKAAPKAKRRR